MHLENFNVGLLKFDHILNFTKPIFVFVSCFMDLELLFLHASTKFLNLFPYR